MAPGMGYERRPRPRAWREAPIDPERLARAVYGRVAPSAQLGVYEVACGGEPHWVNLVDPENDHLCDCEDHVAREILCKHALAVMIYAGDRRTLYALAQLTRRAAMEGRLIFEVLSQPTLDIQPKLSSTKSKTVLDNTR